MREIHFANPQWAHALWAVLGMVAILFWLDGRKRSAVDRFISPSMQLRLARPLPRGRRWLALVLLGLSGAMLVVALMRPQGPPTFHPLRRAGAQIMVCLDVSKSMLAEDTAPSRLERAKAELSDLLTYLDGDQVGLIAFAGKASVLCPLTPDYGFFRLILNAAGPHSVGRGGTRLEEPIRKALAGFGSASGVSRAILLVTDGEDHDSYPLKAAEDALQQGVKVIAIGFGDESGSQIQITDPQTGVRTLLKDRDGKPVVSRLDGETLRRIALITEGAYVPAGTGALDLESIYQTHIQPLMRGRLAGGGRVVRRDHYQWAVLAGLVLLVMASVAGSAAAAEPAAWAVPAARRVHSAAALALLAPAFGLPAAAASLAAASVSAAEQEKVAARTGTPAANAEAAKSATRQSQGGTAASAPKQPRAAGDPRTAYNQALAVLDTNHQQAETLLAQARRDSGTDAELRFCATYNLGWVAVRRADQSLKDNPEQALAQLRAAADWFQEAVRLRPDSRDARHNLEVLLRRLLELADSLRKKDDRDLAQRLDALIEAQRRVLVETGSLVQDLAGNQKPDTQDRLRGDFRRLSVDQRKVLSDSESFAASARQELDALQAKKDEQRAPQEELRAAQLSGLLQFVDRANQRMGQARSHMRSQQPERAFRRAAAALWELKRARDQLRHPVEVLGVLLADATQLAAHTSLLAASRRAAPAAKQPLPQPPAWLTADYLQETQQSVNERTGELVSLLQAGVEGQSQRPAGPPTAQQQKEQAASQRFLDMVRQAMPFLRQAVASLEAAGDKLASGKLDEAVEQQFAAIASLQEARERFLDLRGLIEWTYAREAQIQDLLADPKDQPPPDPAERAVAAKQLQEQNLERAARLDKAIAEELRDLPPAASQGSSAAPSKEESETGAARQRLELARPLLEAARSEMSAAAASLGKLPTTPRAAHGESAAEAKPAAGDPASPPAPLAEPRGHVERALDQLQALRRLFFSVVEHLRETVQRQAELNDDTESAAALAPSAAGQPQARTGPLAARQTELQTIATEIAKALAEQARQPQSAPAGKEPATQGPAKDPQQPQQHQQMLQQIGSLLAKASGLVAAGAEQMQQAAESLSTDPPQWKPARERQDAALKGLAEALALLVPPQPQPQQQAEQSPEKKDQQKADEQAGGDPARLLQAVRDREAARNKDKKQRAAGQEVVDKDW